MYHYSFTNDIRIDTLKKNMQNIAKMYLEDKVPSADENKSLNNVSNTLGFYFNFRNIGACTKYAARGEYKRVLLNFIKKFQYPNPRAKESGFEVINDGIKLAPLRNILRLLYIFYLNDGKDGYLTQEEITEFIFYNDAVAKENKINYSQMYIDIMMYRNTGIKPKTIVSENERLWKGSESYRKKMNDYKNRTSTKRPTTNPEKRQIGILLSLMVLAGCVTEDKNGQYYFNGLVTDSEAKADVFEILTYNKFWNFNTGISNSDNEKSYYKYMEMEDEEGDDNMSDICFKTGLVNRYERNRILFGAPGTGKSHGLKNDCEKLMNGTSGTYERVTFHPDYTYSHFVGTYKPVTDESNSEIKYEFVPGPFMRVYVEALKSGRSDSPQPHLLLIEEINRAKVASVFGDVFQLLDRDDDGVSEYEIHASEDVRKYLAKELGGSADNYNRIKIPDNMFIWATMNSADQGVFPMDTAFKRRWNFEYLGINENDVDIKGRITLGVGSHELEIEWNQLRKAINEKLAEDYKVNEDKLMGPYFLSKKTIKAVSEADDSIAEPDKFKNAFKNKVIMYLYEDAAKQYKHKLFDGCNSTAKYSSVCEDFDELGIDIFGEGFREFYDKQGV